MKNERKNETIISNQENAINAVKGHRIFQDNLYRFTK